MVEERLHDIRNFGATQRVRVVSKTPRQNEPGGDEDEEGGAGIA